MTWTPEKKLIAQWVSPFTIATIKSLFGSDYFSKNTSKVLQSREENNSIVQAMKDHDNNQRSMLECVNRVITGSYNEWFSHLDLEFNTKLVQDINSMRWGVIIDLFSQGAADLLTYKSCNSEFRKDTSDEYLFSPLHMVYVDLLNKEEVSVCDRGEEKIDVTHIRSDVLQYISLLPDNSVQYILSWIDEYIINNSHMLGAEYLNKLNKEIYRTTKKWWLIVGRCYHARHWLLKNWFHSLYDRKPAETISLYCYQK